MSKPQSFLDGRVILHAGDCREVLRGISDNSVDSVVTDPPYHLHSGNVSTDWSSFKTPKGTTNKSGRGHKTGFMGKKWDGGDIAFQPELWAEVLRVLKPGGYNKADWLKKRNARNLLDSKTLAGLAQIAIDLDSNVEVYVIPPDEDEDSE